MLGLFLIAGIPVTAIAQNEYISNSRAIQEDCIDDLDGNCGVLVISPHDDLVLTVAQMDNENRDKIRVVVDGERQDGLYAYRLITDANFMRSFKVEVGRAGNVYRTDFVVVVKPDFLIAYRVEEVSRPIRMDDQTKANDLLTNESAAEVEIIANIQEIPDLKIIYAPELQVDDSVWVNPKDQVIHTTSLRIPLAPLTEAKNAITRAEKEYNNLFAQLETNEKMRDEEQNWDRLETLEQQKNQATAFYAELSNIELYADKTNHLTIDISDLTPRAKRSYAILPLKIKEKVYVTELDRLMSEAAGLFSMRKYKAAQDAYLQAKASPKVSASERIRIAEALERCDTCMLYDGLAAEALKTVLRLKKEGNATQQEIAQIASAAIEYMQILSNINPSVFYTKRIESMEKLLARQPLFMRFTIVEWLTLREGVKIPDVEVWAYRGNTPAMSDYSSDRRFRRLINKQSIRFEQIGISDSEGVVEFDFDRTNLPTGIFFCPDNKGKTKIKYMNWSELMRQSSGDFMKRQIRLKMFTK